MSDEKEMTALVEKLRSVRGQIDRIETRQRIKESAGLAGKCFRFRNCYSCPKTDADYFWLYRRVTSVTKDGYFSVFQFQTDSNGRTEIEPHQTRLSSSLGEPITLRQFQHAWKVLANRLNHQARDAKALRT